jgi:hypothetical protein
MEEFGIYEPPKRNVTSDTYIDDSDILLPEREQILKRYKKRILEQKIEIERLKDEVSKECVDKELVLKKNCSYDSRVGSLIEENEKLKVSLEEASTKLRESQTETARLKERFQKLNNDTENEQMIDKLLERIEQLKKINLSLRSDR